MTRQRILGIVTLIAGLSGFCSLVYQVVWDRTVKYNFGGDSISSAIVTGTFLLGLGLGAYLFGKWRGNAYKTYAAIELAIGVFGIMSFYLIAPVAATLAQVLKTGPDEVEGLRAVVVVGCILLLLPPCTLIGGTLPLMFRCFVRPLNFSARTIGLIYGINTLGASLGILAVPLFFLNRLSLPATLAIIGGTNILLAVIILLWSRRMPAEAAPVDMKRDKKSRHVEAAAADAASAGGGDRALIYALAFISGFIAISFEVSLFRAFPIVNPSSPYNFPLVLVFFLFALALGSIVFTRGVPENRAAILYRIGWLTAGSALGMFIGIWVASYLQAEMYPISFLPMLEGEQYENVSWVLLFCAVLVVPVPLLTGAIFPLLLRLRSAEEATLAENTGRVYLINSLGSFAGAVLGKFAGFPLLGTQGFLTFVFLLASVTGIGVMVRVWRGNLGRESAFSGALPAGMLISAGMLALIMPSGMWLTYITGGPERNWEVREGVTGIAQLWWLDDDSADVRVNGQYMSRLPHHPRHVKQEIFLLAQPKRERVLVLGIGGAGIVRSLVEDEQVKSIDVVDWSYELPDLLSTGRAGELLNHALNSSKVRIVKTDARVAVGLYDAATFDMIFDNLTFASWAGATGIRSQTYFEKIRNILKPEGVYLMAANYSGDNRLAVLAGLVNTFEIVKEHRHAEIVIATSEEPQYFDFRIIQLTEPRAGVFGLNYTAPDALPAWFRNEFIPIGTDSLEGVGPIRDELLIYEYFWRPI
jgi:spermidine synthase